MSKLDNVALERTNAICASDSACHFEGCHSDAFTLDVGVLDQLVSLQPAMRVCLQHASDQLLCSGRLRLMHSELATLDLLVEVLFTGASEWELTCQHHIQQNPQSPNIDWHSFVVLLASNLRRHVTRRATEYFESLVGRIYQH